jgi:2-amino-4-hydroxy-6-hydroxymethyldihydropteridine diphosphokinase
MAYAQRDLKKHFPTIRFSEEMETEAIGSRFLSPFSNQVASFETTLSSEEVRAILKQIEHDLGRLPEEKSQGVIRIDIDLLMYDDCVLKPQDMERDFVIEGLKSLTLS